MTQIIRIYADFICDYLFDLRHLRADSKWQLRLNLVILQYIL